LAGDGMRGFSVADRGPGFQEVAAEALFDRYAQAQEGRRAGGAGLGLSIVRWIAEQHGGAVTASNRDGGGAIVVLTLRSA
ncbi:MAG: ATP-binding protein, partial [Rubrimonas sp.]